MSASPADLANRLHRTGVAVGGAPRAGMVKACQAGKAVMLAALTAVAPSRRLSGVGASGARVGVRYTIFGSAGSATGILQYTGPVHFIQHDMPPHTITPRRRKALVPASREWAATRVHHPGSRGRDFAGPAEKVVLANAARTFNAETNARIRAGFGI